MKKASLQQGFTLVELLVSLALFTVIVVAAVGSLYTVNQASVRVNAMRTVLDNLNFATESMSRTVRTSTNIVCGGAENLNQTQPNCPFGNAGGLVGHSLSFTSTLGIDTGKKVEYRLDTVAANGKNNGEIDKCVLNSDGSLNSSQCVAVTAPEMNVTQLVFYVDGASKADAKQPSVMMIIQGIANAGKDTSPFAVQTLISQRAAE